MIPRLTYGVDRRGYASVICLNSSSASVVLPLRMKFTARLKSAVAFAEGGPAGPNDVVPAPGATVEADALPVGCGSPDAVDSAGTGAPADPSAAGKGLYHGIEEQPPNNATTSATSIECRRDILRNFRLAVACRLQLRQHLETLLDPLVIHTILRARSVDLVRLDGLLFEWENLLFQQRVVLFQLVAFHSLGTLGAHVFLRQRPV